MSFTRETLSDFFSKIFIIGMGNKLKKSLDEGAMMDNFEEWIIKQKPVLLKNKGALATIISELRVILTPIVCGDGDKIGLFSYIKERIIQNYPAEINPVYLNQFTEEAIISAARKIYNFFEILAQQLELDSDFDCSDIDSEWENDFLSDLPLPKKKPKPKKVDIESVLKQVFYKETEHYIFHHLKSFVPPRVCSPRPQGIEAAVLAGPRLIKSSQNLPRPRELLSDEEGEPRIEWVPDFKTRMLLSEPPLTTQASETLKEKIALKCRFLIRVGALVGALFSPLSLVAAFALWDLFENKKKKEEAEIGLEVKSELFKAAKTRRQNLIRPRELLSEDEGGPLSRK